MSFTLTKLLAMVNREELQGMSGIEICVNTGPGRGEKIVVNARKEITSSGASYIVLDVEDLKTQKRKPRKRKLAPGKYTATVRKAKRTRGGVTLQLTVHAVPNARGKRGKEQSR